MEIIIITAERSAQCSNNQKNKNKNKTNHEQIKNPISN